MPSLDSPDWGKPCGPFVAEYLTCDIRLCRVYNAEQGRISKFGVFDWNPTIPADNEFDGGRFDATTSDPFKYIYASLARRGPETAIAETLWSLVSYDPSRGRNIIQRSVINARSMQYFKLSHEVTLADLRSLEGCNPFHAPQEITTDRTRNVTREWGSYIRASSNDIQGFMYNSTKSTGKRGVPIEPSVVLFEDRLPLVQFDSASRLYSLRESKGRDWANQVLVRRGVLIVG